MHKQYLFCILSIWGVSNAYPQIINVDAGNVIKSFNHNPVGINLNYLMDDDSLLNPETSLTEVLSNMKLGRLRFPGGEKADNYLWSVAPYKAIDPHFATQGNCNWPNNDPNFSSNNISPLSTTMDFEEFMVVCDAVGAEPLIVVAGDAHYNSFCPNPPTRQDLITNATEWVRYANVNKGYNIKYWAVGNESWHSAAYDAPSTATQYANDLIQFSIAMKAVDSTISIVANSQPGPWLNTLLQLADAHVDAIAISNYPNINWSNGYETYRNGNPNFVSNINATVNAIGNRDIRIIVSEYNSIDWNHNWPNYNDLGRALINFQMLGDQISIEKVDDAYLWNTRWVNNASDPQHLFDAIDANGELNASGKALSMWGNYILDNLVFSDNNGYINSFASMNSNGSRLNIFLINKDYASHSVTVKIANYPTIFASSLDIAEAKLSGSMLRDIFPEISYPSGNVAVVDSQISIQLDPLSIHVIQLSDSLIPDMMTIGPTDTGVISQKNLSIVDFSLFPNPVKDKLTLRIDDTFINPVQLKIYNSIGKEVYTKSIVGSEAVLDLSNLAEGLYWVAVQNKQQLIVKY